MAVVALTLAGNGLPGGLEEMWEGGCWFRGLVVAFRSHGEVKQSDSVVHDACCWFGEVRPAITSESLGCKERWDEMLGFVCWTCTV